MQPIAAVVHRTTFGLVPTAVYPNKLTWFALGPVMQFRIMWRGYKTATLLSDPKNFHKLAAGHTLNYFLGDNKLLRFVAMSVLISDRINTCMSQVATVHAAYEEMLRSFKADYPPPRQDETAERPTTTLLSPHTVYWLRRKKSAIVEYFIRTISSLVRMVKEVVLLSGNLLDATEAFLGTPEAQTDAVTELFLKSLSQRVDDLIKNQELLLGSLKGNKKIIRRVLKGVGSPIKFKDLVKALETSINASRTARRVANVGDGIIVDVAKNAIFGLAASVKQAHRLPKSLIPEKNPKWQRMLNGEQPKTPKIEWPVSSAARKKFMQAEESK